MPNQIIVNWPPPITLVNIPTVPQGIILLTSSNATPFYGANGIIFPSIQRNIDLTSAGNLSAVNFTFTGINGYGQPISEVIAGPNANTVVTANEYHILLSVSASAPSASNLIIKTGALGKTQWNKLDLFAVAPFWGLSIEIFGTAGDIQYEPFQTFDSLQMVTPSGIIVNQNPLRGSIAPASTTSGFVQNIAPLSAFQLDITGNLIDSTAALILTIIQQQS